MITIRLTLSRSTSVGLDNGSNKCLKSVRSSRTREATEETLTPPLDDKRLFRRRNQLLHIPWLAFGLKKTLRYRLLFGLGWCLHHSGCCGSGKGNGRWSYYGRPDTHRDSHICYLSSLDLEVFTSRPPPPLPFSVHRDYIIFY